jgi:hypothetical protein
MTSISNHVPRLRRRRAVHLAGSLAGVVALSGCATAPYVAKLPNPEALPAEAVNLRAMLTYGCLPIVEGRRTAAELMPKLGFVRRRNFSWPMPSGPPYWAGNWRGIGAVDAEGRSCGFEVQGPDVAIYEQVAAKALHAPADLKPKPIPLLPSFENAVIPAAYSGCVDGVSFSYSYQYQKRYSHFQVHLSALEAQPDWIRARTICTSSQNQAGHPSAPPQAIN